MTPAELQTRAIAKYGETGWRGKFAWDVGVQKRTVDRWMAGSPITLATEHAINHVLGTASEPKP